MGDSQLAPIQTLPYIEFGQSLVLPYSYVQILTPKIKVAFYTINSRLIWFILVRFAKSATGRDQQHATPTTPEPKGT